MDRQSYGNTGCGEILIISAIKLKYGSFQDSFFYVFMGKTKKKIDFPYIVASMLRKS